jgi:hypothetical protein
VRQDRKKIMLRVWKEKAPDSNPYYPNNKGLRSCLYAAKEIMKKAGPCTCEGDALAVLNRIEKRFGNCLSNCEEPLVRDLVYFLTHHIIAIARFAGGHRGPIVNDVELDLSIALLPGFSVEEYMRNADAVCESYGVKLLKLSEIN